jgi:hypothetical protein
MSKITLEDERLMEEIREDSLALTLLRQKCRWEGMPRYATLREWGDPRKWRAYRDRKVSNETVQE